LPSTIAYLILEAIYYKFKPRAISTEYVVVTKPSLQVTPKNKRPYDVVVFGCTGYTGGLLVDHLAFTYDFKNLESKKLNWAISGRSVDKLNKVRDKILAKYSLESLDIIVVDTSKFEQVEQVVNETKVVITTVGPYNSLGNEMINACALYGTDYVDITGEADWVQPCISSMQDLAVKSGARIINFCGNDCIPWDLCTYFMNKELTEKHDQGLKKIQFYNQFKGAVSGGTIVSSFDIFNMQKDRGFKAKFTHDKDPWFLYPGEKTSRNITTLDKNTQLPHFDFTAKRLVGKFIMSEVNQRVLERTNVLNNYGNIEYGEKVIYLNFMHAYIETITLLYFACFLLCKPFGCLAKKFLFPKQGDA